MIHSICFNSSLACKMHSKDESVFIVTMMKVLQIMPWFKEG